MADTRGLMVNRDIYDFETMVYRVYDCMPKKHHYTMQAAVLNHTGEMRHYTNLACHYLKGCNGKKAELFSFALGECADVQNALDHLYDLGLMSNKTKSMLDVHLEGIRGQLSKLVNSFSKQLKGADRREETTGGGSINQEEG